MLTKKSLPLSLERYVFTKLLNIMEKTNNLRQQVIGLKKGAALVLSIDEHSISTIRNYASEMGFRLSRTYVTKTDRKARTITVKRTF